MIELFCDRWKVFSLSLFEKFYNEFCKIKHKTVYRINNMAKMNIAAVVHIKSSYESWEKLMLSHNDNQERVDAGKVLYGKVNDKTAILLNLDMDEEDMAAAGTEEFSDLIKNDVESHDFYIMNKMEPPA